MPEETTTQEAAPETQAAEEPSSPTTLKSDPLLQALWKDLGRVEDGGEENISPAPATEPEATDVPSDTGKFHGEREVPQEAPPEVVDEDKLPIPEVAEPESPGKDKFEIRHQPMLTGDDVRDAVKEAVGEAIPIPTESVTPPEEVIPDAEDGLLDEQREELELARIAEKANPDKHKGLADGMLKYYSKLEEYVKEGLEASPERSFDEDDMDYQDWVSRARPKFSEKDRKNAELSRTETRAYERAKEEVSAKYSELEKRQKALELKPQIDARIKDFGEDILKASESNAAKIIAKDGFGAADDSYPLESAVYQDTVTKARDLANEYLGFANGLIEFDYNNSKHKWLLEFINHNGEWFEENGGNSRRKDGKSFVNRARYAELHAAGQASDRWTFDHEDILQLLGANAVNEADSQIKTTLEAAQKYGFVRQEREVSAGGEKPEPANEDVQPVYPPKAAPSVSPGNADPDTSGHNLSMGADVIETLGLR